MGMISCLHAALYFQDRIIYRYQSLYSFQIFFIIIKQVPEKLITFKNSIIMHELTQNFIITKI